MSTAGICKWNVGPPTACVLASSACGSFTGADDATCKAYNPFCLAGASPTAATPCVNNTCASKTGVAGTIT